MIDEQSPASGRSCMCNMGVYSWLRSDVMNTLSSHVKAVCVAEGDPQQPALWADP